MIRDRVRRTIALAGLVPAVAAGGQAAADAVPRNPSGNAAQFDLALQEVAGGFSAPLLATNAGDGTGRLFVAERDGRVYVVRNGRRRTKPFLDISARTLAGGEQGLLGLAFHPNFEQNRILFVNYTGRSGNTVVAHYKQDKKRPWRVKPTSRRVILRIGQP